MPPMYTHMCLVDKVEHARTDTHTSTPSACTRAHAHAPTHPHTHPHAHTNAHSAGGHGTGGNNTDLHTFPALWLQRLNAGVFTLWRSWMRELAPFESVNRSCIAHALLNKRVVRGTYI